VLVFAFCYIVYKFIETKRWKKIYKVLEKTPEQLAKLDKNKMKKKNNPRVEITFRGAEE
jgi:amino acid permease